MFIFLNTCIYVYVYKINMHLYAINHLTSLITTNISYPFIYLFVSSWQFFIHKYFMNTDFLKHSKKYLTSKLYHQL